MGSKRIVVENKKIAIGSLVKVKIIGRNIRHRIALILEGPFGIDHDEIMWGAVVPGLPPVTVRLLNERYIIEIIQ